MNNNKGFIGMGVILAIIAVLVVGAGAYYVGTKNDSVPQDVKNGNYQPVEDQNNSINSNNNTESNSIIPSIKSDTTTSGEVATTLDTSNWKTYKNTEYNFELKYPPTITPKVKISNQGQSTQVTSIFLGQMIIAVPSYFTIDQKLEGKSASSTVKNIQVDGKKAVSVSEKSKYYTYVVTYILKSDNKNVYMTVQYNIGSLPDSIYNNMYQQMFDTFKFTSQ